MKRTLSKVLSILLLGCMTLMGCQLTNHEENNQSDVAMGRYLEEVIDIGKKIDVNSGQAISIFESNAGKVQVMFDNGDKHFSFYEQQTDQWREFKSDLCDAINKEKLGWIELIENIAKENKTYVIGYLEEEEVPYVGLFKNNELQKINIAWNSSQELIKEVHISQDKLFMLNYQAFEIEIYDLNTGKFLGTIGENIGGFTVIKDKVYATNFSKNVVACYDILMGKLERSIECKISVENNKFTQANDEGDVYLANDKGIFYLAKDEQIVERIMNGDLYSLSCPSRELKAIKVCNGTIYGVFRDRSNNQHILVKYVYHKDVPTIPQNQVNIFSLYDCPTLKQAAQVYKEKHPGANISFEVAFPQYSEYKEADKRQVIEKLNAQILAGDAPDLFVLDDLPIDSYQKAGLFEDLSGVLENVSQSGVLFDNLMHTHVVEDKVYALPLRFGFVSAVGEAQIVKDGMGLGNLAAYQMCHPNEKIVSSLSPQQFLEEMSGVWKERLFSIEDKVNQENMKHFLIAIKTLQPMPEGEKDCYYKTMHYEGIDAFIKNKCKVEMRKIDSQNDLQVLMYAKANHEGAVIAPRIEQVDNNAYLKGLVGINSQSSKKEEVKELLEIALSKEVQQAELFDGFPVYKEAAKNWILTDNNRKNPFAYYTLWDGNDTNYKSFDWGYLDDMHDFAERLETAQVIQAMDANLLNIIQQESEDYFEGLIEVDEAVRNIGGKVELYLNEQN